METLNRKFYGLKTWQWVAVAGGVAFIYFRMRGGSASGTAPTDTSGNTDPTAGAQGFGQGYTQGYGTGLYQGQITPVSTSPPPGTKNCRPMKDPSGKTQTVCGPGHFVKLPGTSIFRWVEGAQRTIYGYGKKGHPFYNPPPVKIRKTKSPSKGAGSGKVPVKH